MKQKTIKKRVEVTGIGLHSGEAIKMLLEPEKENSGIYFIHAKSGTKLTLKPQNITDTKMATVLGSRPNALSTIEHFLSAVYAYGIDNLKVTVFGNELPIMDGSAMPFCMLLDEAQIQEQNALKPLLVIKKEIKVEEGDKFAILKPSKIPSFDFTIEFDHPVIGREHLKFIFNKQNYLEHIAKARTFGFLRDLQYLQSINLALGASLDNAVGLDDTSVLNPEGLRYKDEFVRHKILDAMGDMMVSGYNIIGEYVAYASSHDLNNKLLRKLFESEDAFEIVNAKEIRREKELVKVFA